MGSHKSKPSGDRTLAVWQHQGGRKHRVMRLRYMRHFDDRKQKRADRAIDRVSAALDALNLLGVEARVSYREDS